MQPPPFYPPPIIPKEFLQPMKIFPSPPSAVKSPKSSKTHYYCLCRSIYPVLFVSRLMGLLPMTWHDKDGRCVFEKSLFWLIYSFVLIGLYTVQTVFLIDFASITTIRSLLPWLGDITAAIYSLYVIILTLLNIYRCPKWVRFFNNFQNIVRDGIFCQSVRHVVLRQEYGFLVFLFLLPITQSAILLILHYSDSYATDIDLNDTIYKILQAITFVFYILFFTIISLFIGILACFEKLTISALNYKPVHPMKGIDETNNTTDFFGVIRYEICKEEHPPKGPVKKLQSAELLEYLRILHEDISLSTYEFNACMNPQFLFHTVIELAVLIIHWYAVVAYIAYSFRSPEAKAIHINNCFFVAVHTLGLFLFLKNAQQLKNMIHGLTSFLLEYSTRISSPEEHQQVRIFIEKLNQHRPFTASGVFTIDLGIAGPISANILTYVLVALQFEIPQE